ncbi:MAG: calcium-binding protein [Planktomarina sp.]
MANGSPLVGHGHFDAFQMGAEDDWIIGDGTDVLAVGRGGLQMADSGMVHLSMGTASYVADHSVVAFIFDADTQAITGVEVIWPNTQGQVDEMGLQVAAGETVSFGLLTDGAGLNDYESLEGGVYDVVALDSGGFGLTHTADDGATTSLAGDLLMSTTQNTASGSFTDVPNTIQIGFEDGYGGDDGDFNDLTFTMYVSDATVDLLVEAGSFAGADRAEGGGGSDTILGGEGSDLLVGDTAWNEWQFRDGEWHYHPEEMQPLRADATRTAVDPSDDVLIGGTGNDVLLGNNGDDTLRGGVGDDTLNGGKDNDQVTGGNGADLLNLEDGNDLGVGGDGADIINGGAGNDVVYGDLQGENLLVSGKTDVARSVDGWDTTQDPIEGVETRSQTIETTAGQTYGLSIDVAANLAGGSSSGVVEVFWNNELIAATTVNGPTFETLDASFQAAGESGVLEIRSEGTALTTTNSDGFIATVQTTASSVNGDLTLDGFAPGQAQLYQVLDGQLTYLDPGTGTYIDIGNDPGVRTNAIGFNIENNLIYGVTNQTGIDANGTALNRGDLIVYDANGQVFKIGAVGNSDVVGDMDTQGNLWTFDNSLDRITKIKVDNVAPDGTMVSTDYPIDPDAFPFRVYDLTFEPQTETFVGVKGAPEDGGQGLIVQVDISGLDTGGQPVISTYPISGTVMDDVLHEGMPKGSFGAAFSDADGNIYVSLNRGDHDLDASTDAQGAIYHVVVDPTTGAVTLSYIADTEFTTTNDGTMDPRASDPFGGVDAVADVLIENISLVENTGSGDQLRGGDGDDIVFGGGGDDLIHGGDDSDNLSGDQGADILVGGQGADILFGGEATDYLIGGSGQDQMFGGNGGDFLKGDTGTDTMFGGFGDDRAFGGQQDDQLQLGAGNDRGFGGQGDDSLNGGVGDDHLEGGAGNDNVFGSEGADFVKGFVGDDLVRGGAGDDRGYGGDGADTMSGGSGSDTMTGEDGADTIFGNEGADVLKGGQGADALNGGTDDDMIFGGSEGDQLSGSDGDDKVVGGTGADTITGGTGADHLWGGNFIHDNTADIFVYSQGDGNDMIHDFESDLDRIDLSSYGMTFEELQARVVDLGWATEIDLSDLASNGEVDRIILRSVDANELIEDNFIF